MRLHAVIIALFLSWNGAMAAEVRPIADVNIDGFIKDTQFAPQPAEDDHVAFVWWIPHEFWRSVMARDASTTEIQKKAMLDAMSGISILAVVQADISVIGMFGFYSKDEVEKAMAISFTDGTGQSRSLRPMTDIDPELKLVLSTMRPILEGAMGNLGANMHFYVLDDRADAGQRLMDPYNKGLIQVTLARKNGNTKSTGIELPLNSLFVPRLCPNGKPAHISWNYCPWSGTQLGN